MIRRSIFLMMICLLAVGCFVYERTAEAAEKIPPIENEHVFLAQIHKHLLNRDEKFTIVADEKINVLFGNDSEYLFEEVFESSDKTSDDFDYLRYNVKTYRFDVEEAKGEVIYRFVVSYHDSLDQANTVHKAVEKALKNLRLQGASPEVKAIGIHDFIGKNASLYLGSGRDNARAALKKSSSSRGYALLTYKMMREADIPCRIVSGKIGGASQIWNIVKLDDQWYHMDNGAEALVRNPQIPIQYTYFLVGTHTMKKTRVMDEFYQSVDFESEHPLSRQDYAGRGRLILASDVKRTREKSGVGLFNEAYDKLSNIIVDPVERINDRISDGLLDGLSGVFGGI